jgi:rubrerythrin
MSADTDKNAEAVVVEPTHAAPQTLDEVMALAYAMEVDAAQRYAEFADAMEIHNNREVSALFAKMADIERKHAAQIMQQMGWHEAPPPPPATSAAWGAIEPPENAPGDSVHYLMRPYHALQVALACEQRAERFYSWLAANALTEPVRAAANELRDEEREHVELVQQWLAKVPVPDRDWAVDPDPPRYLD